MLVETNTLLKEYVKTVRDHEKRIRVMEGRQTKILTIFSLASAAVGSGILSIWHKLFN